LSEERQVIWLTRYRPYPDYHGRPISELLAHEPTYKLYKSVRGPAAESVKNPKSVEDREELKENN